ncbi:hypothetical protein CP973_11975 [Streptomyces albofaciens JCM 4342]|uniref:hypothetical protein n=1 Tax=Streptomyces albofaciens TaxID=66866 RepID=UPI00123BC26D|nr:hypothetical protein [Streptomyces albofaciens]KAA6222552.1 hypothetical protein CP973_11975 [Streptomyces albofaciens JCM 4342]
MADTKQADEQRADQEAGGRSKRDERRTAALAKAVRAFAAAHGGSTGAQLAHIGRGRVRIALVGADGQWGNLVADSQDIARAAAERAGAELHEDFDGDFAAKVRTGRYEWSRMAGIQVGGPANT